MLIAVAVLTFSACGVFCLGPTVLRGSWQLARPRLALCAHLAVWALGVALLFAASLLTVLSFAEALRPTLRTGALAAIAVFLSACLVFAALGFIFMTTPPLSAKRRQAAAELCRQQLSAVERPGFTLTTIANPEPFAVAVPGGQAQIVVTDALAELLTPGQLQAVLAHEYAHLAQRHAQVMRIIDAVTNMLGLLPGMRRAARSAHLLIELAADDTAARQAGPAELANALAVLAKATGDESMHLRAERLTTKSWPRAHWRTIPESIRMERF